MPAKIREEVRFISTHLTLGKSHLHGGFSSGCGLFRALCHCAPKEKPGLNKCDVRHICGVTSGHILISRKLFMSRSYDFHIVENCLKCPFREERLFCNLS